MSLQLIEHTDPRRFHDAVIDYLHEHGEAENSAMIGLVRRLEKGYSPISVDEREQPLLWTLQGESHIELVALQTLKTIMLVTRTTNQAATMLAEELAAHAWNGTDVLGAIPSIETIAARYEAVSKRHRRLAIRLRTFQLDRLIPPKPASGFMRRCEAGDREIIATYLEDFFSTAEKPEEEKWLDRADRMIREGRLYVWVDGEVVSMAAWSGGTRNGIRISAVYTPPNRRGCGYASNLVAQLTQLQLDQGKQFCFLNTDLANPTSNSIYQKMGYRMVSDSERWTFGYPED